MITAFPLLAFEDLLGRRRRGPSRQLARALNKPSGYAKLAELGIVGGPVLETCQIFAIANRLVWLLCCNPSLSRFVHRVFLIAQCIELVARPVRRLRKSYGGSEAHQCAVLCKKQVGKIATGADAGRIGHRGIVA